MQYDAFVHDREKQEKKKAKQFKYRLEIFLASIRKRIPTENE